MTEQLTKLSNQIKENFLTVQYGWVFVEITNYFISEESNINIEIYVSEKNDQLDLYVYHDWDFEKNKPIELGMDEFSYEIKDNISSLTEEIIEELNSYIN